MPEINVLQHPDSIWTWKSNKRSARCTLWLPYFSKAEKVKGKTWRFAFNGGEVDADLSKLDCITFYGASGEIPLALIDSLAMHRVPLLVHRRNVQRPSVFLPAPKIDAEDILTRQILVRANKIKRNYIARTLARERFRSIEGVIKIAASNYKRLARLRDLKHIRAWEAEHARRYWRSYFTNLGHPDVLRRGKGAIPSALNAGSLFLSGIILRWILVHKLSPSHGFLHEGTEYTGLVYDLMEPFRYLIENAVTEACSMEFVEVSEELTKNSISCLKKSLEKVIYVPATHQMARRKNLLHGIVLALRAYLAGDMQRFVIPTEGERKGGRPPKVSYQLPGNVPV